MAKSIIRMAFFFTIPISRMMPISAITLRSVRQSSSASTAPTPGRRNGRENRDGMDQALIQHPQHDIDGDQGGNDQDRFVAKRILERLRGAGKLPVNR